MPTSRTVRLSNGTTVTYDYTGLNKMLKSLQGKHAKIISDGVSYGIHWELGHMTPSGAFVQRPFLVPAGENERAAFTKALKQAADKGDVKMIDVAVGKAAVDIEKRAKQIIMEIKLIDTGALYGSIAVHDPEDINAGI
jgi:hypothetical protein